MISEWIVKERMVTSTNGIDLLRKYYQAKLVLLGDRFTKLVRKMGQESYLNFNKRSHSQDQFINKSLKYMRGKDIR